MGVDSYTVQTFLLDDFVSILLWGKCLSRIICGVENGIENQLDCQDEKHKKEEDKHIPFHMVQLLFLLANQSQEENEEGHVSKDDWKIKHWLYHNEKLVCLP